MIHIDKGVVQGWLSFRGANKRYEYCAHDKLVRGTTEQMKNCVYETQNRDI